MTTIGGLARARLLALLIAAGGVGGCVTAGASEGPATPSALATDAATSPTTTSNVLPGRIAFAGPVVSLLTPTGLVVSPDGGTSWSDSSLPSGVSAPSVMAVSAASSQSVFLAAEEASGSSIDLYGRTSSNAAWTKVQLTPSWPPQSGITGPARTASITLGPLGFVAVVGSVKVGTALAYNSIFVSQDNGRTFVQHQAQEPSDANIIWDSVAFATPQAGIVVVGPTEEGVIHTSDGGAHWTKSVLPTLPAAGSFELGQPVLVGSNLQVPMSTQPSNGSAKFAFLVSTDGGATFSTGPSISLPDGQSASASAGQRTWVVSSASTTIYETSDNGQTWASVKATGLPQNVAALTLTGTDSATAEVVTTGCTSFKSGCSTKISLVRTTNGGLTWAPLNPQ